MTGLIDIAPYDSVTLRGQGTDAIAASTGEVLSAQFGSGLAANPIPRLFRAGLRGAADTGIIGADENGNPITTEPEPQIDSKTLNEKYGIPGHLSFDQPMSEYSARDLYDNKHAELVREDTIARRAGGVATGAVARMGTGLIAGLLDPVNLAVGLVPVVGEARVASMLGRGAIEAMGEAERAGVRAVAGGVSGGAAMAALQPLEYGLSRSERDDFTMADALRNIAFGAALGGGLHVVGGAVADRVTGRYANPITQRIEDAGPEARAELLQGAVAQHLADEPVNVAPALDLADAVRAEREPLRDYMADYEANQRASGTQVTETSPAGFTTAKGSTYEVHEDGTTTRNKSFHPEHGPEDVGLKPRSEKTIYVDSAADASNLSGAGLSGVGPKGFRLVMKDGKATLVWENQNGRWGTSPASRDVAFSTEPAVGKFPVEAWGDKSDVPGFAEAYSNQHGGNEITAVDTGPRLAAPSIADFRQRQTQAINELAPKPEPIRDTAVAADQAMRATEALPDIERQIAEMEAAQGLPPPAEAAGERAPAEPTVAAPGETRAPAAPERPAELVAADAEVDNAAARAAAYERAAKCIIGGG